MQELVVNIQVFNRHSKYVDEPVISDFHLLAKVYINPPARDYLIN